MVNRIGFFIVFSFFLVALSINFLNHKVLAAVSDQTSTTSTATFTIQGGNGNDVFDASGNKILKPNQVRGYSIITLDASLNGRTAELPVGTLLFLRFPKGESKISITPAQGVVEGAKGIYHLSKGDIALLKIVGQGTATITVTTISTSSKGTKNAAGSALTWSGYYRTGTSGSFTDTTSQWTVPTASSCGSGDTYSSAWTGIDDGTDTNHDLIQTGTESDCVSSSPFYQAWWEILPANETPLSTTTYPVSSGDSMFAEVKQNSGTNWTITIKNLTQNWTFSTNQTYSGPQSTGEWILERPIVNGSPATLTNYGSTTFTNDTQNGANPQHSYATDSLNMTSDGTSSGTKLSVPSNPNSLTDAFAVAYGSTQPSAPASWSNNSPSGTTHDTIQAMAASSTSNVWASGYESVTNCGSNMPVTYHNDGTGWTKYQPSYSCGSNPYYLNGVATSSPSDAWIVGSSDSSGSYHHTLVKHWTCTSGCSGSSWTNVTSDNPSTSANDLYGVAYASTDVFAVGSYYNGSTELPLIEKWNSGTSNFDKQTISLPSGVTNAVLYGVSFSSSTDGWAVGEGYNGTAWYDMYYHYSSGTWTGTLGSLSGTVLYSVAAISSSEYWAVGSRGTSINNGGLIMHYTSGSWTQDNSFNSNFPQYTYLQSVSADSSSDVWIGGYKYFGSGTPYTMHYNGSTWSQVSTPSVSGTSELYGIAVNSGVAWAGGFQNGTTYPNPLTFKSL